MELLSYIYHVMEPTTTMTRIKRTTLVLSLLSTVAITTSANRVRLHVNVRGARKNTVRRLSLKQVEGRSVSGEHSAHVKYLEETTNKSEIGDELEFPLMEKKIKDAKDTKKKVKKGTFPPGDDDTHTYNNDDVFVSVEPDWGNRPENQTYESSESKCSGYYDSNGDCIELLDRAGQMDDLFPLNSFEPSHSPMIVFEPTGQNDDLFIIPSGAPTSYPTPNDDVLTGTNDDLFSGPPRPTGIPKISQRPTYSQVTRVPLDPTLPPLKPLNLPTIWPISMHSPSSRPTKRENCTLYDSNDNCIAEPPTEDPSGSHDDETPPEPIDDSYDLSSGPTINPTREENPVVEPKRGKSRRCEKYDSNTSCIETGR